MNANDTLLQMEGVTKVFVTDEVETHALAGIHMELRRGEYVSISGPSGCGKSTLLAILGLLDTPSDGKLHVERPAGTRSENVASGRASAIARSDLFSRRSI